LNTTLKWILIVVGLAVIGNVLKEAGKANKESDARVTFKDSCKRQAQGSASIPADRVDAVCSCVIDKTVSGLGNDGFVRLANVKNATDTDRQVLMESMATCMDEHLPPK
jgi:hypothetical protein